MCYRSCCSFATHQHSLCLCYPVHMQHNAECWCNASLPTGTGADANIPTRPLQYRGLGHRCTVPFPADLVYKAHAHQSPIKTECPIMRCRLNHASSWPADSLQAAQGGVSTDDYFLRIDRFAAGHNGQILHTPVIWIQTACGAIGTLMRLTN